MSDPHRPDPDASAPPTPPPPDRERLLELRAKTAFVRHIHIYPVKSLEGLAVDHAPVENQSGLRNDRRYAFFSQTHGGWIRAKDFPQLIQLRTRFDLARNLLHLASEQNRAEFDLALERPALSDWMSNFLQHPVLFKETPGRGFFDDSKKERYGISLISTATLQRLAAWFPGLGLDELRRRLRTNVEVDGVEPFWEECLIPQSADHPAPAGSGAPNTPAAVVGLTIGTAQFTGALSCPRCSVPERDSRTAELDPVFRTRFIDMRAATRPRFLEPSTFKLMYSVAIRVQGLALPANAPDAATRSIAIGDAVRFGL